MADTTVSYIYNTHEVKNNVALGRIILNYLVRSKSSPESNVVFVSRAGAFESMYSFDLSKPLGELNTHHLIISKSAFVNPQQRLFALRKLRNYLEQLKTHQRIGLEDELMLTNLERTISVIEAPKFLPPHVGVPASEVLVERRVLTSGNGFVRDSIPQTVSITPVRKPGSFRATAGPRGVSIEHKVVDDVVVPRRVIADTTASRVIRPTVIPTPPLVETTIFEEEDVYEPAPPVRRTPLVRPAVRRAPPPMYEAPPTYEEEDFILTEGYTDDGLEYVEGFEEEETFTDY